MKFYQYFKLCRIQNDFTQEQLVNQLYLFDIEVFGGLNTSTLSKWERNITQPTMSKQIKLMKFFQKQSGLALPCWHELSYNATEDALYNVGIKDILRKSKQYVLSFPSKTMHINDLKVYPVRDFSAIDILLDMNLVIHKDFNPKYTQIQIEQFKEWALHPSNFFIVCEYKGAFVGIFFTIRLKQKIFDKLINFKMKKSDIVMDDFASMNEEGCNFILSFYALNQKISSLLIIRYYAYLITNQEFISSVGSITSQEEAKKIILNMHLNHHKSKIVQDNIKIDSYQAIIADVFAHENVINMIMLNQNFSEE